MQVNRNISLIAECTALISFIAIFSTFAGVLTDIKFSRHKAVLCSSYGILISTVSCISVEAVAIAYNHLLKTTTYIDWSLKMLGLLLALIVLIPVMIYLINALQFGMDQLHDSPTEDSILFIHWYVWISYVTTSLSYTAWNLTFEFIYHKVFVKKNIEIIGIFFTVVLIIITMLLLIFSLCVVKYKKVWFHIEPAGINPYKLVYRVVKFAYQHKVPLRRSAFTYCEDELPSRMDLGKRKYGGPFTTKQVEDVKAFLGILKVLTPHLCFKP